MTYNDWAYNEFRRKHNAYGGIGYYRIVKPSQQIVGHAVKVIGKELMNYGKSNGEMWENVFKDCDILWTHYFKEEANAAALFYTAKKLGKKVIIDLDDNFWDVPKSNLLYNTYKPGAKDRAFLSSVLFFADALTTTSEPLRDRIIKHFKDVDGTIKKVYLLPNMNDRTDWEVPKCVPSKDKFIIGYQGSNSHQDDLVMVLPSIVKIMEKYPHVELQLMGAIEKSRLDIYFEKMSKNIIDRISLVGATESYDEFPDWLSKQKWNVGIAPLVDTAFTRCKSPIKFFEYTMVGLPVIASRVYPYFMDNDGKALITDQETGLLVKQNEWFAALEDLILHPEKCKELSENAFKHVMKTWQYKDGNMTKTIEKMIEDIYSIDKKDKQYSI